MNALEICGVEIRYDGQRRSLTAVAGVDLTIAAGQAHGLVGESGSGKSSLARAIVGLQPVTRGRIHVFNIDVTNARGMALTHLRRKVQMVFQNPFSSLNPRMMIGEAIGEAVRLHRPDLTPVDHSREVIDLLGVVGLDPDTVTYWPHQFSGGQRQRLAIARALAAGAELLVLDEVTSALDVSVQAAIINLLRDLQRQRGMSLLFISHDLAITRYISDMVSVMHLGRIVESAPAEELFSAPRHPYTRTLLDAVPGLGIVGQPRTALDGEAPDPYAPPSGCRFHPRCPVGPRSNVDRELCVTNDPAEYVVNTGHRVACHFVVAS